MVGRKWLVQGSSSIVCMKIFSDGMDESNHVWTCTCRLDVRFLGRMESYMATIACMIVVIAPTDAEVSKSRFYF